MSDLFYLVHSLHFRLISMIRLILERTSLHGLNSSQVFILLTIGDDELKASDFKTQRFTYYSVMGLVTKEYVTWEPNLHDGRSGFYKLTDKGSQVVKFFHHLFIDQEHEFGKDITVEELEQLITMLGQIDAFYVNQINQRPLIDNL